MRNLLAWLLLLILFGCGGGGGGGQSSSTGGGSTPSQMTQIPDVTLVRVEIVAASTTLASGLSTDLQLFAVFSNGIRVDVTGQATFSSSNPASVGLSGNRATAAVVGSSTIMGQFQGASAQIQIQVSAATLSSLRIDPPQASLAEGLTQRFRAFGTFSDSSVSEVTTSVSWSVQDGDVAEFQASPKGLLKALRAGNTSIVASLQGRTAQAEVSVTGAVLQSLEVSPSPISLPVGIGQQFSATGVFSDGSHRTITEDVSWSSNDTETFLVSDLAGSKGIGAGLKTGAATLTVTSGGITGQGQVTVTEAVLESLTLTPLNSSLPSGLDLDFQASGHFSDGQDRDLSDQVIWNSSAEAVASISNLPGSTGRVHAKSAGPTTISAQLGNVSQSTGLTVTAAVLQRIDVSGTTPELPAGFTRNLSATGHFSDGTSSDLTDQVLWSSGSESVAVIDQSGQVTAKTTGTSTISAQKEAIQGAASLTVSAAVLESLTLAPLDSQLPVGLTLPFTATGHYSDGSLADLTSQVTWTSGSPAVATISNAGTNQGLARALQVGTTEIQAQFNGLEAKTNLEITAAVLSKILISPKGVTLPIGLSHQLKATAVFSDGRQTNVTDQVSWSSGDTGVATLAADGRVSGAEEGATTAQAVLGSVQGQVTVTVSGTVTGLKVVTGASSGSRRARVRCYALATLSDGTSRDASADVQWTVQPATFGSIAQGSVRPGELTLAASGPTSAQVLASLGPLQNGLTLGLTTPNSWYPLPRKLSLPLNYRRTVRVFGNNLAELPVTWESDDPAVATVIDGQVVANGAGNATLTPRFNGNPYFVPLKVHVPASPLVSLDIHGASAGTPAGAQGAVSAEAVTQDGERLDVTDLAEWSSSDPEILLVVQGRTEARQSGSAQLTARFENLTGSTAASVGGTSPALSAAVFVDSSLPAGGDGSQAHPFNNLAQAMDIRATGAGVFLFSGEGSGDGLQYSKSLPAFELKGQKSGWTDLGIAAGSRPQIAIESLALTSNTLLKGLAVVGPGNLSYGTSANTTVDDLSLVIRRVTFADVGGLCRIVNSEVVASSENSGEQVFSINATNPALPGLRSIEIGNVTLNHLNATNGFVDARVANGGSGPLVPQLTLNIHDNIQQLDRPGSFAGQFGTITVEVAHADISVTNNTGTDARFTVTATSLPSRLLIADNTWATLSVDNTDTATDLEILRNRLSSFISVRDRVLNPFSTPSAQTRARIEDNHADADLQVTTAASQVLIQRNTATGLLFNGGVAVDYARLFGVRDNRLNDGILRLNLGGTGSQCLAVTGNQGDGLVLNGESELVVEGLSMLNTLNQFNLITLGNTFVEAAVDSCGIPH